MTELQKKSFELLQLAVEICDKHNIKYYLVCGSALGAVKYKGFIPWDDDIDIGILRPDYNRFLEIAQNELPEWCFLQNYRTESLFPQIYSKIRNSNTTFIEKSFADLSINQGIFIDVFPIDGHPKKDLSKFVFKFKMKVNAWIRYSIFKKHPNPRIQSRNKILRAFGVHKFARMSHKYLEKLLTKYSVDNSDLWCNYGNWQGELEYAPKWHYGDGIFGEFEGLKVRIPENFDAYLTQKYGDWRSEPPIEKQKSHHNCVICDTEVSYLQYLKDKEQ